MPSRRCSASPACRRRDRGWQRSTLRALFADEAAATAAAALLLAQDWTRRSCCCSRCSRVPDQDWVRLTQSQFAPVAITTDFWIVPSWHEPPADARRVIRLDPGLAFGTGTHPTTRMCLRWLAAQAAALRRPGRACSTTAAARASWPSARRCTAPRDIDAVDIDPAAVQSTDGQRRRPTGSALRAGLPRRGRRRLRAGAGQHPGHAAEAAGAAAVRAPAPGRRSWCWPASWSARPTS